MFLPSTNTRSINKTLKESPRKLKQLFVVCVGMFGVIQMCVSLLMADEIILNGETANLLYL